MKSHLSMLSLLAASMPSFGARIVEKPAPHYGTPARPYRKPYQRRHGPKSMPDGYYAQVTPLKHLHSAAKFRCLLAAGHEEMLREMGVQS